MFGFLKRAAPSPEQQASGLAAAMLPVWRTLLDSLEAVSGPVARPYEAGIFICSVALVQLGTRRRHVAELGNEFAAHWLLQVEYLVADTGGPQAEALNALLFERHPVYKALMSQIESSPVQLALMLVEHCNGQDMTDRIVQIMPAVPAIEQVMADIALGVQMHVRS
ncbi:hypothetical protein [Massilia sp. BSC265]|uniref:hypothetical protein n=1 Tax=Massilia sp. BSC265 TaxID=1549812 RepID=UPI0004E92BFC|nr:hypothetical protein [Massilia sp. BSC265]KFI09093.1 hypothetical protein JN27_00145 [Massilia sp. BSC265]